MDDLPPWSFIVAGLAMAAFSAFLGFTTEFGKFTLFFIAAAAFIAFGVFKFIVVKEETLHGRRKATHQPPTQPIKPVNPYLQGPLPDNPTRPQPFIRQPLPQERAPEPRPAAHPRYRGFYNAHPSEQKSKFNIPRR